MNSFKFVGKMKVAKDGYVVKDLSDGKLESTKLRFMVKSGTNNTQFLEASALVWTESSNRDNVILTCGKKSEGDVKYPKMTINWDDRNKAEIIEQVAHFKKLIIDLNENGGALRGELLDKLKKEPANAEAQSALAVLKEKRFEFVHEYDFINKLNEVLNDETYKDKLFKIRGNIEYAYKKDGGRFYKTFKPVAVELVSDNTKQETIGDIDFYYDSDSFVEAGDSVAVNGYIKYYDRAEKTNLFGDFGIIIPSENAKAEGFKKMFNAIRSDEVKHVGLNVEFFNGSEIQDITADDLDDEMKQMVEWGIYTVEEAIKQSGGVKFTATQNVNKLIDILKNADKYSVPSIEEGLKPQDLTSRPVNFDQVTGNEFDSLDI